MNKVKRTIKPAGYRVLIRPDLQEEKTQSGIIIQREETMRRTETVTGEIIDVGPTAWKSYDKGPDWAPWAKVGDKVYFNPYACKFIDVGDDDQLVMVNDDDVQAIIVSEEIIDE